MRCDTNNELLSDAIHVIYVELSKLGDIIRKSVDDMTDLEKWALFLKYANVPEYREAVNKVIDSKEALQMAGSLLMSVSKDERERAVYRSRRMYQTDMQSNIATAEDRGEQRRAFAMARNMIAGGEPVEKITEYTGLTREEVEKLSI
jgi:predicted transposase/invertase (TIGR01784 family)